MIGLKPAFHHALKVLNHDITLILAQQEMLYTYLICIVHDNPEAIISQMVYE